MAFVKRTWLARLGQGLNKFFIGEKDSQGKQELTNSPDSIAQQGDVISADNLNDLEDRIDDAVAGLCGRLIWENENPDSDFSAQTLYLDSYYFQTEPCVIGIDYTVKTGSGYGPLATKRVFYVLKKQDSLGQYSYRMPFLEYNVPTFSFYVRDVTFWYSYPTIQISFYVGRIIPLGATDSQDNSVCVPLRIYQYNI